MGGTASPALHTMGKVWRAACPHWSAAPASKHRWAQACTGLQVEGRACPGHACLSVMSSIGVSQALTPSKAFNAGGAPTSARPLSFSSASLARLARSFSCTLRSFSASFCFRARWRTASAAASSFCSRSSTIFCRLASCRGGRRGGSGRAHDARCAKRLCAHKALCMLAMLPEHPPGAPCWRRRPRWRLTSRPAPVPACPSAQSAGRRGCCGVGRLGRCTDREVRMALACTPPTVLQ